MSRRWIPVVLAAFYALVVYGGASLKADYCHVSQYISELNATGSDWSWQIGYLGFFPLGLLGFLLLLSVAPYVRLSGISKVGYWLLIAEPIIYMGSAFAPCDLGCPTSGSLSQNAHNVISVVTLLMTTLGLIFLSFNDRLAPWARTGWILLAAIFIGLYTLALIQDIAQWRGLLQRLAEGILYGCLCLISWKLLLGNENQEQFTQTRLGTTVVEGR